MENIVEIFFFSGYYVKRAKCLLIFKMTQLDEVCLVDFFFLIHFVIYKNETFISCIYWYPSNIIRTELNPWSMVTSIPPLNKYFL